MLYGYGKILDVDLSTGKMERRDVDPEFAREYIGGMGFSSRLLYDEVGPDVDPFSADNIVVFANGPLTGTQAPCSGRTEITTKSPLTGIIGSGNTGGIWGAELKHAGIDVIVIRKQADKPVYLWIDDDVTELRDAGHLWGKETSATCEALGQELGSSPRGEVSVLAIGPAGEHLVRYACPLNDYYHVAARSGAGGVMGHKKLKAIAVRGSGATKIARPEEFRQAVREARQRLLLADKAYAADEVTNPRSERAGTLYRSSRELALTWGALPARNFQSGYVPNWLETRGLDVGRKYIHRKAGVCYACPIGCFNLAEVNEGKYAGTKSNRATHGGHIIDWGAKCYIDNLPAIWKCKETCQQLGMDYVSASGVIAFAMELFQRGIITTKDTDGLELTWGNEDATIQLLHKIAFRKGFGDVLAEGSVRAAKVIGQGAEQYVVTMKGMELFAGFDPRSGPRGFIFGVMTNPRGGDNLKNTHFTADRHNPNWGIDKFDMFEDVKRKAYNVPPQEVASTWEGKPMLCRWFEDLYCAVDCAGMCFFPVGIRVALGPTYLSKLLSACTGWDLTPQDFVKIGEKSLNVMKAYNVRLGLTRKDDEWPDRLYTEPLPDGPGKGAVLSRDVIGQLLDEYYELRGWDKRTGLPTKEQLNKLGLQDVADELIQLGRIPPE